MANNSTLFSNKCAILSDVWMDYRNDEELVDFVEYNDLGLPLAYCAYTEVISVEEDSPAGQIISETFDLLLGGFNIPDAGYESFEEILQLVIAKNKE